MVDSSSVITATVSQGGTPVPNGTAVEFVTDAGSFVQGASPDVKTVIKTTTNGVASISIFSSTAVIATITATVNNVTKSTSVRFVDKTVTPPPPSTAPTISGVTPSIGSPAGGQIITITGTNFRAPVVVLFDPGTGVSPTPVTVVSTTDTAIQVITPKVNIAAGQQQKFNITVITQQGSASEQRVSTTGAFTFQLDVLTPTPTTASPATGPIDGGTRVTIFGSGFQAPVQVFVGAAEAQVIKVAFDQLQIITPTARSAGVVTGAVAIRIINVNSAKEATLSAGFAFTEKMTITAVGPTEGSFLGGTRVTIEGNGFDTGGVAVVIGGVGAAPVFVSGTKLIAVTGAPLVAGCANVAGPTSVVNINNGDSATGPQFTFVVQKPTILSISNPLVPGAMATVTVAGQPLIPRITINGQAVQITNTSTSNNTTTYTVIVPSNLQLKTQACVNVPGVLALLQTGFDVVFTDASDACTDTVTQGGVVNPPAAVLALSPQTFSTFTTTLPQVGPPAVAGVPAPAQTLTVTNAGLGILTVTSVTQSGAGCVNFAGSAQVNYTRAAPGTDQCTLTVTTSAGTRTLTLSGQAQ